MFKTTQITAAADWIARAQRIVAFTGAGISTASGIPDFRSEKSGLWEQADPMQVASIFGFRKNPQAFYDWVHPLAQKTMAARPNAAHRALVELEEMGTLQAVITQNIDMLHSKAGNSTIYELHGHMREATCTHCFRVFEGPPILEQFLKDGNVPHCPHCSGVIKPNVILFGEQLPIQVLQKAQKAARNSDLLLVIGSSLEVAPASDIPLIAKMHHAQVIIINREATALDSSADLVIHGQAEEVLPAIMERIKTRV